MAENVNTGDRPSFSGDESDDGELQSMIAWLFSIENDDEDAITLSKFLEASSEKTIQIPVKIIDDPSWQPMVIQKAVSYITINGNEELCGSSFSDSDTSYMVGISGGGGFVVGDGGAWDGVAEEARGWSEMEGEGDWYCDDDMLDKFLGGGEGDGDSR